MNKLVERVQNCWQDLSEEDIEAIHRILDKVESFELNVGFTYMVDEDFEDEMRREGMKEIEFLKEKNGACVYSLKGSYRFFRGLFEDNFELESHIIDRILEGKSSTYCEKVTIEKATEGPSGK